MIAPFREFPSDGKAAFDWRPGKLWSLWDMIECDFKSLMRSAIEAASWGNCFSTMLQVRPDEERGQDYRLRLADGELSKIILMLDKLLEAARPIGLIVTIAQAERLKKEIINPSMPMERDSGGGVQLREQYVHSIANALVILPKTAHDELESKIFLTISPNKVHYYRQSEPLFGQEVFDKFDAAREDIEEAGKCIALWRSTAAVFHLMRALENAAQRIASKIGATIADQHGRGLGWGVIANNMKPIIDGMPTGSDEQVKWYRVQHDLVVVNRAWRVPTNHPKETYTLEQANEIFDAAKAFMKELAPLV